MRSVVAGVAVVLLLLLGAWFVRGPDLSGEATPAGPVVSSHTPTVEAPGRAPSADAPARAQRLREGAAAREAMRRRIVAATTARESSAPPRAAAETVEAGAARRVPAAREQPQEEAAAPTRPMVDRTGNRGYLVRVLNEQLMPLLDECGALVREQHPELTGMLMFDVEIVGDEDIGGVIDSVEPSAGNEVREPEMLDCVRESLLSVTLPPPEQGGRDAVMLSMPMTTEP